MTLSEFILKGVRILEPVLLKRGSQHFELPD
jgi:hypothetical protein